MEKVRTLKPITLPAGIFLELSPEQTMHRYCLEHVEGNIYLATGETQWTAGEIIGIENELPLGMVEKVADGEQYLIVSVFQKKAGKPRKK